MSEKMERLKTLLAEVADLNHVASLLEWDQQVFMPSGGGEARGHQQATIQSISHVKFTSDEIGMLLSDLEKEYEGADPDSDDIRLLSVTQHEYEKATRVPAEYVAEHANTVTNAYDAWVEARSKSDFSMFLPHLAKVLELKKRYISFFPPTDHPYDVLLDDYERGMKTADVKSIFEALRPQQVDLIRAIASRPQIEDSFLFSDFDPQKQWDFGVEIISKFGYDWKRGRQDKAPHPFTTSFSINDVRITTRFEPDRPTELLFSSMHEAGHALYDMGHDQTYERTPLANGASLAIHESQSRMWENLVGRSMPFWEYFYPQYQKAFPSLLGSINLDTFYRAINKVRPSLIRVNADEATYNLHIMLRLELEIAMIEGTVQIKDLPEIWNDMMGEYLGIVPTNDAKGVLQDVHWSNGLLGYFSTYALGNLISAQLWEKITADIPDLYDQFRKGEFGTLLGWLREKIHVHGNKYEPQELVQRVTGSKINADAYVRYLKQKFSDIYGL